MDSIAVQILAGFGGILGGLVILLIVESLRIWLDPEARRDRAWFRENEKAWKEHEKRSSR